MKKTLALLLSMLMLLSCACFAQAENTDLTPLGAYEETVVITTGKPYSANLGFIDPNDTQENNSMTRLIKDRLNIEVDVLWESDDYSNKLALEFAAGNLPDMFYLPSSAYLLYRQLVDKACCMTWAPSTMSAPNS